MGLARKICFQRPCAMKPQSGASSSNSLWPRGHNKQHFCFFFFLVKMRRDGFGLRASERLQVKYSQRVYFVYHYIK